MKKFIAFTTTITLLFLSPPSAFAAELFCDNDRGIRTAIGCIPIRNINNFLVFFLQWFIGIAGGVGLGFIIYGAFLVITAQGNPEKIQAGRETISAALAGIIFLIFSAYILRFIGVDLLKIPGF